MKTKIKSKRIRRKSSGYDTETPKPAFVLSRKENSVHNPDIISVNINKKIENQIFESKGKGEKLSGNVKKQMELKFGKDFDDVRIHKDDEAANLSKQLNAVAFTSGNDIYFNKKKYRPESTTGKKLLAHELTHTVQQANIVNNNSVIQRKKLKTNYRPKCKFLPKYKHMSKWFQSSDLKTIKSIYEHGNPKFKIITLLPLIDVLSNKSKSFLYRSEIFYNKKTLFPTWFRRNYLSRQNEKYALFLVSRCRLKIDINNQHPSKVHNHDLNNDGVIDYKEIKKAFTNKSKERTAIINMIPLLKKAIKTLVIPKGLDLDVALNYMSHKDIFDNESSKFRLAILLVSLDNKKVAEELKKLLKQGNIVWVNKFTRYPDDERSNAITTGNKIEVRRGAYVGFFKNYILQKLAGTLRHEYFHTTHGTKYTATKRYRIKGIGYFDPKEFPAWKREVKFLEKRWRRLIKKFKISSGYKKNAIKKVILKLQVRVNELKNSINEEQSDYITEPQIVILFYPFFTIGFRKAKISYKFKKLNTDKAEGLKLYKKLFLITKKFIKRFNIK